MLTSDSFKNAVFFFIVYQLEYLCCVLRLYSDIKFDNWLVLFIQSN